MVVNWVRCSSVFLGKGEEDSRSSAAVCSDEANDKSQRSKAVRYFFGRKMCDTY